jgi:uroporphyrin-3 C-methyltransferase
MNPELVSDPSIPAEASSMAVESATKFSLYRGLAMAIGLIAALAMLAVVVLWQKVVGMQEQLATQSAQAQSQSIEARALAKQALSVAQETATRAAVIDSRLSEVALQRSQLDELMQSLSRSRDENLVVDIEAALRLAQQQAQLTGSVEPLLAALKSADQRVVRAAQPRLALLQRAIARDIDRVKSSAVSDTPNLLVMLDELVRLTDELAVANSVVVAKPVQKSSVSSTSVFDTWWQMAVQLVLQESRQLVRVSRIEHPEAALVSPEQAFFLRENLKLKLLNARMGLLARQVESSRADLQDADSLLKKYFDVSARKTQTTLALMQKVQSQMRTLQIPRLDDTLTVLATAAAGH